MTRLSILLSAGAIALAAGSYAALSHHYESDPKALTTPLISPDLVSTLIHQPQPAPLPGSDRLAFFEARKAGRGGVDDLADQQILAGSLARYQAFGRGADLHTATRLADSLTTARPGDPNAWAARSAVALASHDFAEAQRSAERAHGVNAFVDNQAFRLRRFDAALATGQYQAAFDLLQVPQDTSSTGYLARKTRLLDRMGNVEGARIIMARIQKRTEDFADTELVRAWALVELGHYQHHSGDPTTGRDSFLAALDLLPGYPAALEALAGLAFGQDQNPELAETLYWAAYNAGGHGDILLKLSEVAAFQGRANEAQQFRDSLVSLASSDPTSRQQMLRPLALAMVSNGEPERALEFATADASSRESAETLAVLGWVQHHLGNDEQATELFDMALAWGSPEPIVFYLAGIATYQSEDPQRAKHLLEEAHDAEAELGPLKAQRVEAALRDLSIRLPQLAKGSILSIGPE